GGEWGLVGTRVPQPGCAACACLSKTRVGLCSLATPGPHPLGQALHTTDATYTGRNKRSKVKHIKGLQDAQCSWFFQKFALVLRFAVKAAVGKEGMDSVCDTTPARGGATEPSLDH
uniref:Uncharacterized protein n=1 Tax=Chelydra serpentina TaxID=8475 RepID=A0A8C3XKC1_CHESE